MWCWAAVSASVAAYYGTPGPSGVPWTQCEIAGADLNRPDCCTNGGRVCNRDWQLQDALTRVSHLAGPVRDPESFEYVKGETDGGRPAGVRVGESRGRVGESRGRSAPG